MKKILFIFFSVAMLTSCATIYGPNTQKNAQMLILGMTRNEAIAVMGNDFIIESAAEVREGTLEVLRFQSYSYPHYFLYFLNGRLTEFHRDMTPIPPTQNEVRVVEEKDDIISREILEEVFAKDESGNRKTISKNIFGDTVIEDNKGNKQTIKKDIFGNTIIEDNKGNKKTVKKDIFGNTVIEDNKGNKKTIKKDIFGNIVIENN